MSLAFKANNNGNAKLQTRSNEYFSITFLCLFDSSISIFKLVQIFEFLKIQEAKLVNKNITATDCSSILKLSCILHIFTYVFIHQYISFSKKIALEAKNWMIPGQ